MTENPIPWRVIRAAPDMLEALEEIQNDPIWHAVNDKRRDLVEAAIARAQGESDG
jgi:hypothetical protein